jgi:sigma-B regulation protein RsbU (phosphoserine phosphatase)
MSNLYLTYATTHIILSWILRMESIKAWEALDEELRSVGKVQQALLPTSLPRSDAFKWAVNYTTSTHASGDYFDFFELPGEKTGVMIADVSGHGSPAAIVMAMIRLLLHTYPSDVSPPAEVLKNTNRLLAGNILPGHFVTAFYGILDPVEYTLTYSNAGHCHPLLYRASTGEVEKLKTRGGLPLGVTTRGVFDEVTVKLGKGDSLVLYTDGLREAVNANNDMYGDERVSKLLKRSQGKSADDIRDAVIGDLTAYTSADSFTDDLTLLVLKVSE